MKIDFHQPYTCRVLAYQRIPRITACFRVAEFFPLSREHKGASRRRFTSRAVLQWTLLSLALSTVSLPVLADDTKRHSGPLALMLGFESATGGDNIGSLAVNGTDTGDVKAGSGMHFYLGMLYKPMSVFEARLTAGYQLDRSPTSTGTVYMDRFPIEFTPTFCYGNHRFAVGATYHTHIKIHANDFGKEDIRFKNAVGYTIEYGYKIAPFLFVGLRYVNIDYQIRNTGVALNGERTVNADHFGFNLYYQY